MNLAWMFLSANGRLRRRWFWLGFVVVIATSYAINLLPKVGPIAGLLLLWPQVCIHAKRLHDMGRTAWLQLLPLGVGVICIGLAIFLAGPQVLISLSDPATAADLPRTAAPAMAAIAVAGLFDIAFLLWVGLSPGQKAENRFGPPPG